METPTRTLALKVIKKELLVHGLLLTSRQGTCSKSQLRGKNKLQTVLALCLEGKHTEERKIPKNNS